MNLQDQVVYRCIHAQCGRLLPRKVNFCPYCGASQHDGTHAPLAAPVAAAPVAASAPAAAVPDQPAAPMSAPAAAPAFTQSIPPPPHPTAAPSSAPHPTAAPSSPPPSATAAPAGSSSARGIPPPRMPAAPPRREPIRMRWWILGLIALLAIWMLTKPGKRDTEERIDGALALVKECKLGEAQGELIALREGRATEQQLTRVQKAINNASAGCEKKRVRARSWTETTVAVDKLVNDGQIAKAHARLAQFTRRYGEDDETRALKERIGPVPQPSRSRSTSPDSGELAERVGQRPQASGRSASSRSGALASDVLSARRLIDQAERDIQNGDYQAASDKMETCIAMVPDGARECSSFKVYADRMQADMRRCLAAGMEWVGRRCQ